MIMPDSWTVYICDDSVVIPSGSLAVMSFEIMFRAIVLVACFPICILAPDSTIASVFLLGEFGGVPIHFINLIFALLNSILLIIAYNHHLHPFLLLPSLFL